MGAPNSSFTHDLRTMFDKHHSLSEGALQLSDTDPVKASKAVDNTTLSTSSNGKTVEKKDPTERVFQVSQESQAKSKKFLDEFTIFLQTHVIPEAYPRVKQHLDKETDTFKNQQGFIGLNPRTAIQIIYAIDRAKLFKPHERGPHAAPELQPASALQKRAVFKKSPTLRNTDVPFANSKTLEQSPANHLRQSLVAKTTDHTPHEDRTAGDNIKNLRELQKKRKHPHIVELVEASQSKPRTYIKDAGYDLNSVTDNETSLLDPIILTAVALQAYKGVAFMHGENMLHCDIKPSNIMMNDFDGHVRLSGLDRAIKANTGANGKANFGAPETQAKGTDPHRQTASDDLFALGMTLFRLYKIESDGHDDTVESGYFEGQREYYFREVMNAKKNSRAIRTQSRDAFIDNQLEYYSKKKIKLGKKAKPAQLNAEVNRQLRILLLQLMKIAFQDKPEKRLSADKIVTTIESTIQSMTEQKLPIPKVITNWVSKSH